MSNSLCRLCSSKEQIVNVFHSHLESGEQLRLYILLATGIQIKETDIISRMVCHRCCEIAVKLHKYRTNAVANDKLLKEQYGQSYTPPITDQEELSRVASRMYSGTFNENLFVDAISKNALELLNVSIKEEVVNDAYDANSTIQNSNTNTCSASNQSSDSLDIQQSCDTSKNIRQQETNLPLPRQINFREPNSIKQQHPTQTVNPTQKIKNSLPVPLPKIVSHFKHLHPSVQKIFQTHENLIIPVAVLKSDVSPVISLDKSEVSEWYDERLKALTRKLTVAKISIKRVPESSNFKISQPCIKPLEENTTLPNDAKVQNSTNQFGVNVTLVNEKHTTLNNTGRTSAIPDNAITLLNLNTVSKPNINGKQVHRARKRTGRKPQNGRKRRLSKDNDTIEVIPQKKTRTFCNKNAATALNKVDLPRNSPTDKIEQKAIFTSSLELTPIEPLPEHVDCQNILATGRTLEIFMCPVCSLPCDSKKELIDHEKTHLKCKYCKKVIKNLELMKQHLNQDCYIGLVKDNAIVKLTRVDLLPSVIKKYPEAFQKSDVPRSSLNLHCNKEFGINIEDTEPGLVYNDLTENCIKIPNNQTTIPEQNITANTMKDKNIEAEVVTLSDKNEGIDDVVCISDESDNEVECALIPRHTIVEQPDSANVTKPGPQLENPLVESKTETSSVKAEPFSLSFSKNLTEREMIRSLFKKYSSSSVKCNSTSQTFVPSSNNIKYTKSNLIILEHMFSELLAYKIPVSLESEPKISAKFIKGESTTDQTPQMECWVYKTPINVHKPISNSASLSTKPERTYRKIPSDKSSATPKPTFVSKDTTKTNIVNQCTLTNKISASEKSTLKIANQTSPSNTNIPTSVIKEPLNSNVVHTNALANKSNNNVLDTNCVSNMSNTAATPIFIVPTSSIALNSSTSNIVTATPTYSVSTVPVTTTNTSANMFVTASPQNFANVPVISNINQATTNSMESNKFLQLVESSKTAAMQYSNAVVSHSNTNSSTGTVAPNQSSSIMQIVDTPTTVINHYPMPVISQDNRIYHQNSFYQHANPIYQINGNVTNVNKIILFPNNNVQQIPNALYGTSYLNNLGGPPPLRYKESVQNKNQQLNLAANTTSIQPIQNNMLRVKNIHELTN